MNPTQQSAPDTPAGEKETSDPTPGSHAKDEEQPTVPRSGTPKHVEFSVFTVNQRRAMVTVGSLAAFFSPLSSSIYFPALDTIATALSVSTSKIDITVTTYLILQGIAPMFIAGFSDGAGRRPAYMICFTVYLAANLGLGLQNSYAALAVLRCLQSAGSSGTVALANGLVGDLVTSADRALLLFLPETCRKVVGDGSVPPPVLNTSVTDLIRQRRRSHKGLTPDPEKVAEVRKNYRLRFPSPLPTLKVILDIETSIILLTTALMFACFYAVMTGATSSFHEVYHFNNIQTGLMYVPIGAGGVASAFTTGRLLDWNYRRHAKRAGLPVIRNVRQDLSNFNIERARLEIGLPMYYLSVSTVIAYGWVLGIKVNLAAPVILLFLCGWSLNATAQVLSALMVDLWPGRSAAATAANNFFRCELGAASSAAITPMKNAMGWGWAYTTLALIAVVVSPTFWYLMSHGIKLRQKRLAKEKARSESH
ncbi:MFS general substrate transporter [Penicillium chermesinum]|nr:MFS general substrate transporter [Penicillium chermesinum]